jgi:hypothetical protein
MQNSRTLAVYVTLGPVTTTVHVPSGLADCRGRNGWFQARAIDISRYQSAGVLAIVVRSRRYGETPPILIQMPPALARVVARTLLDALGPAEEREPAEADEMARSQPAVP